MNTQIIEFLLDLQTVMSKHNMVFNSNCGDVEDNPEFADIVFMTEPDEQGFIFNVTENMMRQNLITELDRFIK